MAKIEFPNKLVAVLNKNIETGRLMNALAHMCVGLGSSIGQEPLLLTNYQDAQNGIHPFISNIPFIILSANSNKIRQLRKEALAHNIAFNNFTDTMTVGTYHDQIERTKATKEEDFDYFGIVMFGDWGKITELTKKLSLWR